MIKNNIAFVNLNASFSPTIVALAMGKFESLHLGHKALINETKKIASKKGLPSAILIFDPHPTSVLTNQNYKPLFTQNERKHLLNKIGIEYVFIQNFDAKFALLSPEDFCTKLFEKIIPQEIVVGSNYKFGHKRSGTIETLINGVNKYSSNINVLDAIKMGSDEISTSNIREYLSDNDLIGAANLLGFPFFIMGKVEEGRKLGRTIGFPTLNIYPEENKFLLQDGVYSTQTIVGNSKPKKSITNIGFRPTLNEDIKKRSVETFVIGENNFNLYDEEIKVEFLNFIRPEKKFNSLDELKYQIEKDIKSCVS